jgi:xanthine dehydrogenase YagR molybdenum-binding subunit
VGKSPLEVEVQRKATGQPDAIFGRLRAGLPSIGGPVYEGYVTFSFIAHFVEVRVEPGTRRIRVPRVVGVADCGRVVSPRTAASQVRGGVVWGIGAALREASEVDPRYSGFLNADLAEYVIPVNADGGDDPRHRPAHTRTADPHRASALGVWSRNEVVRVDLED